MQIIEIVSIDEDKPFFSLICPEWPRLQIVTLNPVISLKNE